MQEYKSYHENIKQKDVFPLKGSAWKGLKILTVFAECL